MALYIVLLVPDKRFTFDKKRVRTPLSHLILDYRKPSAQRDYEHYLDFAIHVGNKNYREASMTAERMIKMEYSIHFHVFVPEDLVRLLSWFSENICAAQVLEGPVTNPGSEEFHFLLKKAALA